MMRLTFAILISSVISTATAQHNNRVQLQFGNFRSPQNSNTKSFSEYIVNNMGLSFSHNIYKGVFAKINYHRWITILGTSPRPFEEHIPNNLVWTEENVGKTNARWNYSAIELVGGYSYRVDNHEAYFSIGPSFTWGGNQILSKYYKAPGSMDFQFELDMIMKQYLGIVWEIGYCYNMNRISAGTSFSGRHYPNQFTTYNAQLNIGYHFSLLKNNNKKPLE